VDPDPDWIRIRIRIEEKCWIRIRTESIRIHNREKKLSKRKQMKNPLRIYLMARLLMKRI
jgi:hypothetical protein